MEIIATGEQATGMMNTIETAVRSGFFADSWTVGLIILCFFWLIALIWVVKDANARSENIAFQILAIVLVVVLTPVFGLPLYVALRPRGWKWDKTVWRNIVELQGTVCETCGSIQSIEHRCCSKCGDTLQHPCRECGEFYAQAYEYCPFCGAPNIDQ
ncbi:hypothetical protein J5893_03120 [bacterium]|nr:hypothetical protein [bacterium]